MAKKAQKKFRWAIGDEAVVADGGSDFGKIWSGGETVTLRSYDQADDSWLCVDNQQRDAWIYTRYLVPSVTDEEIQTAIESIQKSAAGVSAKHCPTCTCGSS